MRYDELKDSLDANICAVYVIDGQDGFLRANAVKIITNKVVDSLAELNVHYFDETAQIDDIIGAANTMPVMSQAKAVVVYDFTPQKNTDYQTLKNYIDNPNTQSTLIFCQSKGSEFFKKLKVETIDCSKADIKAVQKYIINTAAKNSLQISDFAAAKLAEYCVQDMGRVATELEKLIFYAYANQDITENDIEALVSPDYEYQVYELTNALADRNSQKALEILKSFEEKNVAQLLVIGSIYNHYRRMLFASLSSESNAAVAAKLEVKEYAIVKAREAAKRLGQRKIKKCMDICVKCEQSIKDGSIDKRFAAEFAVLSILNVS